MRYLIIASALSLVATQAAAAPIPINTIVNGGFETGDLSGWTMTMPSAMLGQTEVPAGKIFVSGAALLGSQYGDFVEPVEGSDFLAVEDSYFSAQAQNADRLIFVEQALSLTAGATVSGFSAFINGDPLALDHASVRITDGSSVLATLWTADSGWNIFDPSTRSIPVWTAWGWTAPATGTYFLQLAINQGDDFASFALYDGITVTTPEPSTVALSALILVVILCSRRENWLRARSATSVAGGYRPS